LRENPAARSRFGEKWGKPYNAILEIVHFFEFLDNLDLLEFAKSQITSTKSQTTHKSQLTLI
jgi:hypothetical protein